MGVFILFTNECVPRSSGSAGWGLFTCWWTREGYVDLGLAVPN